MFTTSLQNAFEVKPVLMDREPSGNNAENYAAFFAVLEDGFASSDDSAEAATMRDVDSFLEKQAYLESMGEKYSPIDFYRFLFPVGSFERLGHPEDNKGNGIARQIYVDDENKSHGKRTIVTDGLEQIPDLIEHENVIMSPIGYFGGTNKASNALWMYAMTLDIDYVSKDNLVAMMGYINSTNGPRPVIPRPTFIVNSGHGVHLYYVFEEPIPMYQPMQRALRTLKKELMHWAWNRRTSSELDRLEVLGVTQGFRMVGSPTKMGKPYRLTAYKIGEKVSLDSLEIYIRPEYKKDSLKYYKSTTSLEEAKEKYPEWYKERIVEKRPVGRWHVKRDLYDWFKLKAMLEGSVGHRYFTIMTLAIFAMKCDISEDELLKDAKELQEALNEPNNPFSWDEALKACEAYNEDSTTYPRETLERITAIPMPPNKRNGRKQSDHLADARMLRDFRRERQGLPVWDANAGRPSGSGTKQQQVGQWQKDHPKGKKIECHRETGLSRVTIDKWWDSGKNAGEGEKTTL